MYIEGFFLVLAVEPHLGRSDVPIISRPETSGAHLDKTGTGKGVYGSLLLLARLKRDN